MSERIDKALEIWERELGSVGAKWTRPFAVRVIKEFEAVLAQREQEQQMDRCKWCKCSLPEGCSASCFDNPHGPFCERETPSQPSANVSGKTVEAMCRAYFDAIFGYGDWDRKANSDNHANAIKGMSAAAAVLLDEALGEPSENEMIATANSETNWKFTPNGDYDRVRKIFANRRARLLSKPPVERVTIEVSSSGLTARVFLDGEPQHGFPCDHGQTYHAERYAAGLRLEIGEQRWD